MPNKKTDHLQCGCRKIKKITNGQIGEKCQCSIQTPTGFVKDKKGIKILRYKSMHIGQDASI